jgi:hypothetical protein
MSNPYFNATGVPQAETRGSSSSIRTEFIAVQSGFEGVNAALANLNSIAAGGAYAIPYTFDSATGDADPGAGKLRLDNATQNAATTIRLDTTISGIGDVTNILDRFDASTSTVKGSIRLAKQGDITKWLTFDVTARAAPTGYRNITVTNAVGSSANPFITGDDLMLFFQRTGDKGDLGIPNYLKVSERQASGVAGGGSTAATITQTRVLNTVENNNVPGASLAANTVTLAAGTYKFRGRAPATQQSAHKAFLYNSTDGTYVGIGSNAATAGTAITDSLFSGQFTIAASKNFTVRHWTVSAIASTGLGVPVSSGQLEVYTELEFERLA